jgi:cation diffusion facilitator CzcD-associated flavoprotein CzcO
MFGIDKKIRFNNMVETAKWSSGEQKWTLTVTVNGEKQTTFKSRFVLFGSGYYVSSRLDLYAPKSLTFRAKDYKEPLKTVIPGIENFKGPLVQAQFFDTKLDYRDKDVVVIGSGATAVTVVPAMAEKAKHVTMLQRSANYLMSQPSEDGLEAFIRRWLPKTWAHTVIRWKWLWFGFFMVRACRYFPNFVTKMIRAMTVAELPPDFKHDPHFKPKYAPWEQRMCFCPNSDFFEAIRNKKANVVTGVIDTVTEDSIKLNDGQELHPDIIVCTFFICPNANSGSNPFHRYKPQVLRCNSVVILTYPLTAPPTSSTTTSSSGKT